jgi:NAD-dependent dihydropyrimidine dehydrogenase PreA subunit
MALVITQACTMRCALDCAAACPVDAIHSDVPLRDLAVLPAERRRETRGDRQLFIDPAACICCSACEPECPEGAIFDEDDVPDVFADDVARNRDFFAR